jgi:hypothetical protein
VESVPLLVNKPTIKLWALRKVVSVIVEQPPAPTLLAATVATCAAGDFAIKCSGLFGKPVHGRYKRLAPKHHDWWRLPPVPSHSRSPEEEPF